MLSNAPLFLPSINGDVDTRKTQVSTQQIKERTSEATMMDFDTAVHLRHHHATLTSFPAQLSGNVYSPVYP